MGIKPNLRQIAPKLTVNLSQVLSPNGKKNKQLRCCLNFKKVLSFLHLIFKGRRIPFNTCHSRKATILLFVIRTTAFFSPWHVSLQVIILPQSRVFDGSVEWNITANSIAFHLRSILSHYRYLSSIRRKWMRNLYVPSVVFFLLMSTFSWIYKSNFFLKYIAQVFFSCPYLLTALLHCLFHTKLLKSYVSDQTSLGIFGFKGRYPQIVCN